MADAVSEEIDDLRATLSQEVESKINLVHNRIQNCQLVADKADNTSSKLQFEIDRLKNELVSRGINQGNTV